MYKETKIEKKYDYVLLKETSFHFNTMALELQNKGYEQQGLPNISVDNNGITEISLMFRKLIYKAEYTQCGTLIRDYNFK